MDKRSNLRKLLELIEEVYDFQNDIISKSNALLSSIISSSSNFSEDSLGIIKNISYDSWVSYEFILTDNKGNKRYIDSFVSLDDALIELKEKQINK